MFVEDTTFTYADVAIRTRPSHHLRQAEQDTVLDKLAELGVTIKDLPEDVRLEGGDILEFDEKVWAGLSTRTNEAGVAALAEIIEPLGATVQGVPVDHALHLKSCLTDLPDGTFISHEDYTPPAEYFPGVRMVPEFLGTQVVLLGGDSLLISASAPKTAEMLKAEGFDVIPTPMTEIEKMEGSVTCLSVRIRR